MANQQVNLAEIFKTVATALDGNRSVLNQADTYNHDHGDNMVEIFNLIAGAMKEKKTASPAEQLAYAGSLVGQKPSGSAKYYAGGLAQAAQQFTGKSVTPEDALRLAQVLLGGGATAAPQPAAPSASGDLLGSLLSGLGDAGQPAAAGQPGLDIGDLLNAGMSFLSAKQRGETDAAALRGALATATSDGQTPYRAQSGAVVANALMQALGALASKSI